MIDLLLCKKMIINNNKMIDFNKVTTFTTNYKQNKQQQRLPFFISLSVVLFFPFRVISYHNRISNIIIMYIVQIESLATSNVYGGIIYIIQL